MNKPQKIFKVLDIVIQDYEVAPVHRLGRIWSIVAYQEKIMCFTSLSPGR